MSKAYLTPIATPTSTPTNIASSSLTILSVDVSNYDITYGDSITIDVTYIGSGTLKIINYETGFVEKVYILSSDQTEMSLTVDTIGILFPGRYYLSISDENGIEKYNSITNTYSGLFSGTIEVKYQVPTQGELYICPYPAETEIYVDGKHKGIAGIDCMEI
jgi:hypothetical protein